MKKPWWKTALKVIGNVLMVVFFLLALVSVVFTISSKQSEDGTLTIGDTEFRLVITNSMEENKETDVSKYEIKSIPVNSLVAIRKVSPENKDKFYSSLKVGDVLTFKYVIAVKQIVITHRIIQIDKLTEGYKIVLKGDNVVDDEVSNVYAGTQTIYTADENATNYVIGKVVYTSLAIGGFLTFVKSPAGIISVVIIPCLALMIVEIVKLIDYLNSDKKKKEKEKDEELEMLRKKLKELEDKEKQIEGGN